MREDRIADWGVRIGSLPKGERNAITDVPGVTVGHCTVNTEQHKTGVTVVLPAQENLLSIRSWARAACSTASARPPG